MESSSQVEGQGDQTESNLVHVNTRTSITNFRPPEINDSTVAYALICPSNFSSDLEPLALWKTQKGVPAKIYTIDGTNGIYSQYHNGDNATKIHDFLTDLHESNSNLQWVLLVGDEDIIPSRRVFVNASGYYGLDKYYYSDHYYAGLNNSWDQDGDGIYGEQTGDVNWFADLYVGRLPVGSPNEAASAVEKIIGYETNPEPGSWINNATLWAGLLDGPNNLDAYSSYKDNAIKVTNKILDIVPDFMDKNVLYDYGQLEPGNYSAKTDILNHTSAKQSFNSGSAIINFAGQAYYTGDELAHYIDDSGLSTAPEGFSVLYSYNDARFSNNGRKLPLLYLSTCSVNFSEPKDSNMEQLLTAKNGGVIGLIGNSGKSYRGETESGNSYGNWWLVERFWQKFFNDTVQPGKCLYELKKDYNLEVIYGNENDDFYQRMAVANLVGYNLLGDPELSIWTDTPTTMVIDYSITFDTAYRFVIKAYNDSMSPVVGARVCVYNNETYLYSITNSTGVAVLDIDPRTTGELNLTITAHNYLPKITTLAYTNVLPIVFGITNQILQEDTIKENALDLRDHVFDPDNKFEHLVIRIVNVTDNRIGASLDGFGNIDLRPHPDWNGEGIITLSISDDYGTVNVHFNFLVMPVNDLPTIQPIEDQKYETGETVDLRIEAFDKDNDTLSFSDDSDLFEINAETGRIRFSASDANVGKHVVTITVWDGENSSKLSFNIEIVKKITFIDLYWFPLTVILATVIIIVAIKWHSVRHPDVENKERKGTEKDKKKAKSKNDQKNGKKDMPKQEK